MFSAMKGHFTYIESLRSTARVVTGRDVIETRLQTVNERVEESQRLLSSPQSCVV